MPAYAGGVTWGVCRTGPVVGAPWHNTRDVPNDQALAEPEPQRSQKVNARVLLEPRTLLIALLVIAVASGGKIVGTYIGARLIGRRSHWTALSFGAGLNARGAMEIIIATIGLELGILSQTMFSIVVIMAMATSLMAPPALRVSSRRRRIRVPL